MRVLVTGGAGFIGSNVANRLISNGNEVIVFDNLSRRGSELNLKWLKENGKFTFIKGDTRDKKAVNNVFQKYSHIDVVFHFAAQTAVTTSVINPAEDFEINAMGTFNLLEACRKEENKPLVIFSSTNKVYGKLENTQLVEKSKRYEAKNLKDGINESMGLDFYSPYGCSKGCADQYVRDYSRMYDLPTIVFRMSCIYGERQFGVEDQGWVAWFIITAIRNRQLTIYGNGKQIRDILFIEDYVNLCMSAVKNKDKIKGKVYNIGGGRENTISLLELIDMIEDKLGRKIKCKFSESRPGDQLFYVSDTTKAKQDMKWKPNVNVTRGVQRLYQWLIEHKKEIESVLP
ncbi:MAG: SDR family NAD(P)-dependent oxidoreductase [bacterium]|nr:SDR family NAD(P)-dependent oxidoreductase [bacterium]